MRTSASRLALATLVPALLVLAPAAQADSVYRDAPGEAGAIFQPDHVGANSRAQVQQDLAQAMKQPGWEQFTRVGEPLYPPLPTQNTRAQVQAELQAAMAAPEWDPITGYRVDQDRAQVLR